MMTEPPLPMQASREELAVNMDVDVRGPHEVGGDGRAFQHLVRVAQHDVAILERPRLALVGVHHHAMRRVGPSAHRGPFEVGGDSRPPRPCRPEVLSSSNSASAPSARARARAL